MHRIKKEPSLNTLSAKERFPLPLLGVLYACAFLAGFSENLMNMALVAIIDDYAIDSIAAQWLVTGYMVVTTIMVTLAAFLYRRVKLRTLFFAASALFLAGSLAGLCAISYPMLLTARLLQSAGSGIFIPLMMNTVLAVTPKNKLGSYMSIGGCMITFGPAFAPVVCGSMVTSLGWHSVFIPPICAIVSLMILGGVFLKNQNNQPASLDAPSVVLSCLGLTALSFGLAKVSTETLTGVAALVLAAAAIGLFVRRQPNCDHPLIDLTPMKNRSFSPATILVLIAMMSTFSSTVLLPLYLEQAMGMTAAAAGMIILVPVLVNAGVALISGRVMDKHGEWPLLPLGFAAIFAGFAILALSSSFLSVQAVIIGALLVFTGVGMTLTPAQTAGLRTLPASLNPFGVALMTTFVQLAACIGPSLFTGIMAAGQNAAVDLSFEAAAAQGFSLATTLAAVISAAGLICAFVYARRAYKRSESEVIAPVQTNAKVAVRENAKAGARTGAAAAKSSQDRACKEPAR